MLPHLPVLRVEKVVPRGRLVVVCSGCVMWVHCTIGRRTTPSTIGRRTSRTSQVGVRVVVLELPTVVTEGKHFELVAVGKRFLVVALELVTVGQRFFTHTNLS